MKKEKKVPQAIDANSNGLVVIGRAFKLALANFWRNKFLSLATIMVMAVIIFIFNVILAIQFVSNQALQALSEHVDVVIYLRDDISFYDARRLTDTLARVEGIKEVKYTSKEEALQIVGKTHPKTAEFLQKFNLRNPLPPSISIVTENPEDQSGIQAVFEQADFRNMMQNYVSGTGENAVISSVAENLSNISHFVKQIIFWMVLVFVLGGTLVIVNAIQLTIYTRRNEIYIMRLVGATPNFIRLPFVFEGMLYGIFAVLLSFIILAILSTSIQFEQTNLWTYYSNMQASRVIFTELVITTVLAVICSFSAVQQYLKGKLTVN